MVDKQIDVNLKKSSGFFPDLPICKQSDLSEWFKAVPTFGEIKSLAI